MFKICYQRCCGIYIVKIINKYYYKFTCYFKYNLCGTHTNEIIDYHNCCNGCYNSCCVYNDLFYIETKNDVNKKEYKYDGKYFTCCCCIGKKIPENDSL